MPNPLLAEVTQTLDRLYDPAHAASWDAIGTVCGDPQAVVRKVMLAVDPVQAIVDEAVEWGADLLLTHHPLLLRPVHGVAASTPKGAVVHRLIRHGVALHVCHTNADSPVGGVSESLAIRLGLADLRPLDPEPADPLDKIVTFVPAGRGDPVIDALAAAGAGRIGDYDRCAFTTAGVGTFRPGESANPTIGRRGEVELVDETRVEMVLPRRRRAEVIRALLSVHPYDEPAFDVFELADRPGDRGTGRIGRLAQPRTLREFAESVVATLPATSVGARVAGDPEAGVQTVAVCGGAGDSLLDTARAHGADVYVTSDLRHHPASELREHDDAPALVDVPHWAAEWTWLPVAEARLRAALEEQGTSVETRISQTVTDPWTFHVAGMPAEPTPHAARSRR